MTGWKPGQHVEVRVSDLAALLEQADRADVYRPDQHHTAPSCACASCEGYRVHARLCAEQARIAACAPSADFAERAREADHAIDRAELGDFAQQPLVQEGPRAYPRKRGEP